MSATVLPIATYQRVCPGVVVTKAAQLAGLRFCTYIDGNLTLSVSDNATDSQFNVFDGLAEIKGWFRLPSTPSILCLPQLTSYSPDYLMVASCRGIKTLSYFKNTVFGSRVDSVFYSFNSTHNGYNLVVEGTYFLGIDRLICWPILLR